ncbi:MAG: ArsR family transcriptional regulator [Hyphomicrobiaceae bacterium]|jgi:ArsR family transcriptional regulator
MSKPAIIPLMRTGAPDLFRALADRTRLRLLNLLGDREICVCDLCEVLGESQPKISRHLAYLRRVGLVAVRQRGKWKHYRIASELSQLQTRLIDCAASPLGDSVPVAQDAARLEKLLRKTSDCRLEEK